MKQMTKMALAAMLALSTAAPTWAQGLKDAYKDYFMIGVAVNQRNVTNSQQQALILREFNSMTAENDMKPEPTEPQEGHYPLPFDTEYKPKLAYEYIKDMKDAAWQLPKRPARRPRPEGQQDRRRGQAQQKAPFKPELAFPEMDGVKEDFVPSAKNQLFK